VPHRICFLKVTADNCQSGPGGGYQKPSHLFVSFCPLSIGMFCVNRLEMAQILAIKIFCLSHYQPSQVSIDNRVQLRHDSLCRLIIDLCHDLSDMAGRDCGGEYL